MKWLQWLPTAMPLLLALTAYLGCENAEQVLKQIPVGALASNQTQSVPSNPASWQQTGVPAATVSAPQVNPGLAVPAAPPASLNTGRIRIGSFNIQAFGPSKMNDPWVMERIAAVIRNFDVIAIQEIRSKDQEILNVLLQYVNVNGGRFNYLLGPRLGRTHSKEQYAYIYNTLTIVTTPENTYTVRDDEDLLHREPLVARFAVLGSGAYQPFTFTLANVHTDPDEVAQEVSVLGIVYQSIVNYEAAVAREDDIIMVGDFNADAKTLASVATRREYAPTILNVATNVAGTRQYDNILLNPYYCSEFTGNSGVLDLATYFQITQDQARKISDHLPVWAEFQVYENATSMTSSNNNAVIR